MVRLPQEVLQSFLKHVTHRSLKLPYNTSTLSRLPLSRCISSYAILMAVLISRCAIQSDSAISLSSRKGRNCRRMSGSSSDSWMANDWRTNVASTAISVTGRTADVLFKSPFDETSLVVAPCGEILGDVGENAVEDIGYGFGVR